MGQRVYSTAKCGRTIKRFFGEVRRQAGIDKLEAQHNIKVVSYNRASDAQLAVMDREQLEAAQLHRYNVVQLSDTVTPCGRKQQEKILASVNSIGAMFTELEGLFPTWQRPTLTPVPRQVFEAHVPALSQVGSAIEEIRSRYDAASQDLTAAESLLRTAQEQHAWSTERKRALGITLTELGYDVAT